ncbi:STRC protein, partial [Polyodon spathula]|nr:STRC protein [Polyodon spathula]
VCSATDSLTASQVSRVASNGCARANQVSSFFQAALESYTSPCEPRSKVARSISEPHLSLSDLVCLYDVWINSNSVDPASVALCSENDQESFVLAVCYNGKLLDILIKDSDWLFVYCSNFSDVFTIVAVYNWCTYSSWVSDQIDITLVAFCWNNDRAQFEKLLCEDLGLFLRIMSNPENSWIVANCTSAVEPTEVAIVDNIDQWCRYNEWQDPAAIDVSIISICVSYDTKNFTRTVCTNSTVLDKLLKNQVNSWLNDFCTSSSSVFSSASFCRYGQWAETVVDPSIVALCWDQDQLSFSKNVCCNMDLLEKMTQDPQNEWLLSVCRDSSSETANETKEVVELVCRYSEWMDPAGIDVTDIAVCSEFDAGNFTRAVCTNKTFLLQLIKNLDNTWLLQFCANHSSSGYTMNFSPQVICRYESWAVQIPDPTLVAVCWDYDQGNFVMLVCKNELQLSTMSQDPTNSWVRSLCSSYNEFTNHTSNNASYPQGCIVRDIIRQLNWSCSIDYSAVCQQDSFQLKNLHHIVQCGMQSVGLNVNSVVVEQVSSAFRKAVNSIVALLVTLEESKLVSLQITENIRLSVLKSVMDYLKHEESFTNKRELLQCFGNLLMNLMQTGREVSDGNFFLIKEYFQLPIKDLKPVLMPVEIKAGRQILQYLNRNWAVLKLSDKYLQTMASVFFQKYMSIDSTIFLEFGQLLPYFSVLEISSLPGLQNNKAALVSINQIFHKLTLEQRREFGKWFGSSTQFLNVTQWPLSSIQDAGNLLAYLPFEKFKTLSAAQMFFGLDILLNNTLTGLQRCFIAQSILKTYHNLTAPDFRRLGNLTCLANIADLLVYKQTPALDAIKQNIQDCVRLGSVVPSEMVSSLLVERAVLAEPGSLSPEQLYRLAVIMPSLGIPFINQLLPSQVQAALPAISSVDFSPAQVLPEMLASLGTLISGVKAETLRVLPTDTLVTALPNITQQRSRLSPAQHTALTTKLWGSDQVTKWLGALDPLLPETSLLSVRSRLTPLLSNLSTVSHRAWNTQQAKLLFRESLKAFSDIREDGFLSLGMISQGVDCETLKRRFLSLSSSVISRILLFLQGLPAQLHSSLKKCITNESYNFSFSAGLLEEMGAQVVVELPVSIIKRFPVDMMETFRRIIVNAPEYFLRLPSIKQSLLVDKVVQRLGMSDGVFTGEEFDSLGAMAAFVMDEIFINISRFFFVENIDRIRNYCFNKNKKDILAMMLQEKATFGPVSNWTSETLDQVDRFVFFLPSTSVKQISKSLMTVERMERLFQSQRQWEKSAFGAICEQNRDMTELDGMFATQQFMLQYFLGVLGIGVLPKLALVPSCSNVRATLPSAWAVDSLTSMSADHFSNCLEAIGQDPNFQPGELTLLMGKVKQIYGPASALTPTVIQQLGRIATQFTSDELQKLKLNDLAAITALGRIKTWTSRQLSVLYAAVLNSTKLTGSDLDASTLVALGYGICGIKASEIPAMNPVEFSKSVRWVGMLRLDCTEEQLGALAKLLTHSLAFGPVSSWGPEVFIEIGGIAAGLEDFVLSSLAKEQIEGLTPLAISMIPPQKFSVVFSQDHIRMFSYEQGTALTSSQLKSLNSLQQTALSMVLTSWEDKPVDFRG